MDLENTMDAELDRLLERASASALTTLDAHVDVARRLRELHDRPIQPPADDHDETGETVP